MLNAVGVVVIGPDRNDLRAHHIASSAVPLTPMWSFRLATVYEAPFVVPFDGTLLPFVSSIVKSAGAKLTVPVAHCTTTFPVKPRYEAFVITSSIWGS